LVLRYGFRGRPISRCHLYLPLIDPRCHGNKIWDKIGDNSAPLKENCTLFAPTPYYRARAIRRCHLNFFPANPRCHGNEFWDKIGYNSAPVTDNCALFAPTFIFGPVLSDGFIKIFPLPTPVAITTNFGTKFTITRSV